MIRHKLFVSFCFAQSRYCPTTCTYHIVRIFQSKKNFFLLAGGRGAKKYKHEELSKPHELLYKNILTLLFFSVTDIFLPPGFSSTSTG